MTDVAAEAVPWRVVEAGLSVTIRLTPRGGRDALGVVEMMADGRAVLVAWVRAAPTEGEANRALATLLAKALRLASSRVSITQGAASRIKTVLLEGDGETMRQALVARIGRDGQEHKSAGKR